MNNKTLIEIINSISQKINQTDAIDSADANPNKTALIEAVNENQREVCGLRDWTFLNRVITVDGFETSTTQETLETGTVDTSVTALRNSPSASATEYYAQKFTSDADFLSKMIGVAIKLKSGSEGMGAPSGVMTLLICPDLAGSPDIANPYMTADALTVIFGGAQWETNTFLFTGTSTVLLKNTTYWLVIKWVGANDNGDSIFVAFDNSDATSTSLQTMLKGATTWTTTTGKRIHNVITFYQADYITSLELSDTFEEIYRIYTGDIQDPTCNLLPYDSALFEKNPKLMSVNRFAVTNFTTDGKRKVYIYASVNNVLTWNVYGKIKVADMLLDGAVPTLPTEFQDLLIIGPTYDFICLGYGQQDVISRDKLEMKIEKRIQSMTRAYAPKGLTSFDPRKSYAAGGDNGNIDVMPNGDDITQDV
jgi:hypothetical protein